MEVGRGGKNSTRHQRFRLCFVVSAFFHVRPVRISCVLSLRECRGRVSLTVPLAGGMAARRWEGEAGRGGGDHRPRVGRRVAQQGRPSTDQRLV